MSESGLEDPAERPHCSAKGCRAAAVWALRWNNPKIHTPERRKIWLACDAHRQSLAEFLGRRDLLRDVVPLAELEEAETSRPGPGGRPPSPRPDR